MSLVVECCFGDDQSSRLVAILFVTDCEENIEGWCEGGTSAGTAGVHEKRIGTNTSTVAREVLYREGGGVHKMANIVLEELRQLTAVSCFSSRI